MWGRSHVGSCIRGPALVDKNSRHEKVRADHSRGDGEGRRGGTRWPWARRSMNLKNAKGGCLNDELAGAFVARRGDNTRSPRHTPTPGAGSVHIGGRWALGLGQAGGRRQQQQQLEQGGIKQQQHGRRPSPNDAPRAAAPLYSPSHSAPAAQAQPHVRRLQASRGRHHARHYERASGTPGTASEYSTRPP